MRTLRTIKVVIQKNLKKQSFVFETLLGFLILYAVNMLFFPEDLGYRKFLLHPYWLVVLFIAVQYGFLPGVIAGLAAATQYLYFAFGGIPSRMEIEKFAEQGGILLPVAFVVVGLILGEIRQKHRKESSQCREKLSQTKEDFKRVQAWAETGEKAMRLMEARIVRQSATMRALYGEARTVESLKLEEVYRTILEILAKHFEVQKSSLYFRESGHYVLKSAWGWDAQHVVEGKILVGHSLMDLAFQENKLISVREILDRPDLQRYLQNLGEVLAMVPVRNMKREVVGVVNIEKMDFLSYTRPNLEMIELMIDWVNQTIQNVQFLNEVKSGLMKDPEYGINSFSHFEWLMAGEFKRATHYQLPLVVSLIKLNRFGFLPSDTQKYLIKTLVALLTRLKDEADYIFRYRFDGTLVMLSPMKRAQDLKEMFSSLSEEMKKVKGEIVWGASQLEPHMASPEEMIKPVLKECRIGPL